MKIIRGFKVRGFILAAAFSAGLGFATSASAQVIHSYFIDLNNRTVKELGAPGHLTSVEAINHAGQLVGETSGMGFITGPDGEGIRNLVSLGGNFSRALGINDSGQVVGEFRTATGADHAFITGPNGIGMRDLGTLGRDNSRATGINSAGQVVGVRTATDHSPHAFITGPNGVGMRDLGGIPAGADSAAFAINDAGQVLAVFAPPEGGALFRSSPVPTAPGRRFLADLGAVAMLPAT
jgi:probable HAF family extracellular repeat protein